MGTGPASHEECFYDGTVDDIKSKSVVEPFGKRRPRRGEGKKQGCGVTSKPGIGAQLHRGMGR